MKEKKIIYISGEGHSGTTLLDTILGAQINSFSAGELVFFAQKGIKNREYCACGSQVPDCEIWSEVIREWTEVRTLNLEEYIHIQDLLTSNKNIISTYSALRNPTREIFHFLDDTSKLYEIIFQITGADNIVDSSKAPTRLLILKKIGFNIHVVHIVRRFGDVLNSYKKHITKDLKAGIEHDIKPLNSVYVFFSWVLKNLLTHFFSRDLPYKQVKYDELVLNPVQVLSSLTNGDVSFMSKLKERGPFYPKHLVAGNKIRMEEHIYIANKPMGNSYHRLAGLNKLFARFVDLFY